MATAPPSAGSECSICELFAVCRPCLRSSVSIARWASRLLRCEVRENQRPRPTGAGGWYRWLRLRFATLGWALRWAVGTQLGGFWMDSSVPLGSEGVRKRWKSAVAGVVFWSVFEWILLCLWVRRGVAELPRGWVDGPWALKGWHFFEKEIASYRCLILIFIHHKHHLGRPTRTRSKFFSTRFGRVWRGLGSWSYFKR